jgi:hypothetical protein
LGVLGVTQHLSDLAKAVPRLFSRYNFLKGPYTCPALALPILRVWIKSLQHVKSLEGVKKVAHLVAIIRN